MTSMWFSSASSAQTILPDDHTGARHDGMHADVRADLSVAPGLLIAMPQLLDPNFYRGVVLMIEHQSEGSFGLIVNRPSENRVGELLKPMEVAWRGDPGEVAWWGGPVQPETGWILHEPVDGLEGAREIIPGLHLSSAPDALRVLSASPPRRIRLVLGYAGWGPDQLSSELAEGAWVNSDVTADLVFGTPPESLWEVSVRRLGIEPQSLAPASGIH
jgi:putative transcriptional regulator